MTMRSLYALAVIVVALGLPAVAGPGEAARGRAISKPAGVDLAGIDYVVLVWYRRDQPLESFQYQAYDVRKQEYHPAVDDWIRLMHNKHPSYVVHVRRVVLARERGETEKLKVGSVIYGELLMAGAESGVVLGEPLRIGGGPQPSSRPASTSGTATEPLGSAGASNLNPVGASSPFPMPYPRPHP